FYQEVHSLMKVKHKNIVRFLGYCANTEEKFSIYEGKNVMADIRQKLLCFEFMPKGSLDQYITDAYRGLEWKTRYQIIKGVCEGLHYLHDNSILHLDLKPENILLNDYMEPKIADFGLSRCYDEKESKILTKPSGSMGYMAPERLDGIITLQSDIYSLGVIILEILTGRKGDTPVGEVLESWKSRFETPEGEGDKRLEQVRVCTNIGNECVARNRMMRPSTQRIIEILHETERECGFIETDICTSPARHEKKGSTELQQRAMPGQTSPMFSTSQDLQEKKGSTELQQRAVPGQTSPMFNTSQDLENQDLLIKCVSKDLGFSSGKPIAACLIYRCLLHWRSFEVERTGVFDRIILIIGSAIESQENNDKLTYWLSNSSTLLMLLQRTLKTTGRRSSAASFGRVFSGMRPSPHSTGRAFLGSRLIGGLGDLRQVEAKYPALLFKQQLTVFLEKIYGMIRDNLKKEISPLLGLCIQAPRTSRASLIKGSRSQANALAQQTLIAHWQSIVKILTNYLHVLKANYVPSFLSSKVFTQIFSFINVQLFNSLLLRRECSSFSNGEYVKAGLAELEQWCIYATEEYAGYSWEELKHIRQAVGFLVIHQKPKKTLKEITNDLCPVLSIQQLYRICTMYWDDKYGTHTVSSDVISSMREMMTEDSNIAVSSSFLLDDDSSIPFSVDDITKSMTEIDVTDVDMPPLVQENFGLTLHAQKKRVAGLFSQLQHGHLMYTHSRLALWTSSCAIAFAVSLSLIWRWHLQTPDRQTT
ncbi:unnamed protein product, partial [Urochloa humidicola]